MSSVDISGLWFNFEKVRRIKKKKKNHNSHEGEKKHSLAFLICAIPVATNVFVCGITWQGEVSHNKRPLVFLEIRSFQAEKQTETGSLRGLFTR